MSIESNCALCRPLSWQDGDGLFCISWALSGHGAWAHRSGVAPSVGPSRLTGSHMGLEMCKGFAHLTSHVLAQLIPATQPNN